MGVLRGVGAGGGLPQPARRTSRASAKSPRVLKRDLISTSGNAKPIILLHHTTKARQRKACTGLFQGHREPLLLSD
jgi:hypothetical protein